MAKTFTLTLEMAPTQAMLDQAGHALLFADSIIPAFNQEFQSLTVTSSVETDFGTSTLWSQVGHADDSQSEVSIDITTGKFVAGNLIVVACPISEAREDLRDFVSYTVSGTDTQLHIGVCNTTQSQDYTPAIISNSRPILMISPAQVKSLGL